MNSVPHQHENERVLYRTRLSLGVFCRILIDDLEILGIIALVLGFAIAALWNALMGEGTLIVAILTTALLVLFLLWHSIHRYRATTFVISSERLLFHHYPSHFRSSTQTVRWDAYQESVYEGGPLDALTNSGTLTIRYGGADALREMIIHSLPWAIDIKHYLDKIQSLKAAGTDSRSLPLFMPAKKGKRDRAILSY